MICKDVRATWNYKKFSYAAKIVKMLFLPQPWLFDLDSARTLVMLLLRKIRCFTMIISAWWLWASSKFWRKKIEEIHRNIESSNTPKQVCTMHSSKLKYISQWLVFGSYISWRLDYWIICIFFIAISTAISGNKRINKQLQQQLGLKLLV